MSMKMMKREITSTSSIHQRLYTSNSHSLFPSTIPDNSSLHSFLHSLHSLPTSSTSQYLTRVCMCQCDHHHYELLFPSPMKAPHHLPVHHHLRIAQPAPRTRPKNAENPISTLLIKLMYLPAYTTLPRKSLEYASFDPALYRQNRGCITLVISCTSYYCIVPTSSDSKTRKLTT